MTALTASLIWNASCANFSPQNARFASGNPPGHPANNSAVNDGTLIEDRKKIRKGTQTIEVRNVKVAKADAEKSPKRTEDLWKLP
jgi:hypothetical protein